MLRSLLKRPEEGTGSIERQSAQAKALVMLAKVHKVCLHLPDLLFNSDVLHPVVADQQSIQNQLLVLYTNEHKVVICPSATSTVTSMH